MPFQGNDGAGAAGIGKKYGPCRREWVLNLLFTRKRPPYEPYEVDGWDEASAKHFVDICMPVRPP